MSEREKIIVGTVTVELGITADYIDTVACGFLPNEGKGSNYWSGIKSAPIEGVDRSSEYLGEAFADGTINFIITDYEDASHPQYLLTRDKLVKGIKKWVDKHKRFPDPMEVDADIADDMLQFAVLDEVVYG